MKRAAMLLLLCLGNSALADAQGSYDAGIAAERAGDPSAAATAFVQSLEDGGVDPAVYHGLGNALWRLDRRGPAMAAWSRGLRLAPRNGDIAANLDRGRKASEDRLDPPARGADLFFWQAMLSPRDSALAASFLLAIALAAPLVRRWRSAATRIGVETLASAGLALVLLVSTRIAVVDDSSVVVLVPEVSARSAPGAEGVELFRLHEGAEVALLETHEGHHLVRLPDERKGWIPATTTLSTDPEAPFPLVVALGTVVTPP